jgi:hypothetical protein
LGAPEGDDNFSLVQEECVVVVAALGNNDLHCFGVRMWSFRSLKVCNLVFLKFERVEFGIEYGVFGIGRR